MNFADALDTKISDIEPPVMLPQGTYTWTVFKTPKVEQLKSAKGEWDVVNFPIRAVSAENDVDADELAEFGDLKAAINRISFMFSTDPDDENNRKETMDRMVKFMSDTLGVESNDDTTVKEQLANSVNHQFMALATWRPDGDRTFIDVKNYSAV